MFKDIKHLLRLAAVIAIGLVAFVILRAAVVPHSFGQYGHYRGAAIRETASGAVAFAGHDTCEAWHSDVADRQRGIAGGIAFVLRSDPDPDPATI